MYGVGYGVQQNNFLSFWATFCSFIALLTLKNKIWKKGAIFLPLYPLSPKIPKNENIKNEKKPWRYHILHKCTKNYDHLLHCSGDMVHDGYNSYFHFGQYFSLLTP